MPLVPLLRLITLGIALGFAVIVLGLAAALTSTTETYLSGYFEFAALGIAAAGLTLITVPIMIALDFVQPGRAFTSKIAVELSWLSILWVLWLATAADATNAASLTFVSNCGDYLSDKIQGACRQTSGIQAFSFLNWLLLMTYTIFILVLTIIAQARKHSGVWLTTVGEAPFFRPSNEPATSPVTSQPAGTTPGSYSLNTVQAGGYNFEPYQTQHIHGAEASEGGTGPASVQAGTVHQSA